MRQVKILMPVFFLVAILLIMCKQPEKEKVESLIKIDKNFSNYSLKHGYKKAFLVFADSNAIILRDNSMPVKGIKNLSNVFDTLKATSFQLIWEPLDGDISNAGDIGYTYGKYQIFDSTDMKNEIGNGTYVTVWKKNNQNKWKWVLDCGTEGIGTK